jgi:hypothetical protein
MRLQEGEACVQLWPAVQLGIEQSRPPIASKQQRATALPGKVHA